MHGHQKAASGGAAAFSALTLSRLLPLVVIACAAFGLAALQVPVQSDELVLYSSVSRAAHPLVYLLNGYGLDTVYRPLHAVVEWISYQVFGVWALPSQILSIVLHVAAVALLLDIMGRVVERRNDRLLWLLALVALLSPYTVSAATWIADRPTVIVALALLVLTRHLFVAERAPSVLMVATLSTLALFSKESGIIVPLVAAAYGHRSRRRDLVVASGIVLVTYAALRYFVLGKGVLAYSESGVLFGIWPYGDGSELRASAHLAMFADNVVKHLIAVALPVFGIEGNLLEGRQLLTQAPLWISTLALVVVATTAKPSPAQLIALLIIVANAAVHAAVFRHRMLYVSHFAVMVYVAASPALQLPRRRALAAICATILLVANAYHVEQFVRYQFEDGYAILHSDEVETTTGAYAVRIDRAIITQIHEVYD